MKASLLPNNASDLERAFESAFADMLGEIDPPFPELLDPTHTPAAMLPYLAQDRGVTEWDSSAAEALKRRAVENVWPIRRLAGTRAGLTLAVDELDYDAEVLAWYDAGAEYTEPYSIEVIAWRRDNAPIDQSVVAQMQRNLEYAKSERDELTITLALAQSSGWTISGARLNGYIARDDAPEGRIQASPTKTGTLCPAGVRGPTTVAADRAPGARIQTAPEAAAVLYIAGARRAVVMTDHTPEATAP